MERSRLAAWAGAVFAGAALAAWTAPSEATVQGLYEGTAKAAAAETRLEARLVACGGDTYKLFIRRFVSDKQTAKAELDGRADGQGVTFQGTAEGAAVSGEWADGVLRGNLGDAGSFEAKRVQHTPPGMGKAPPAGAVRLLNGKDVSGVTRANGRPWYVGDMSQDGWNVWEVPIRTITAGEPKQWPSPAAAVPEGWTLTGEHQRVDVVLGVGEDGSLQVPGGGMNSAQPFEGSYDAHVEFLCPLRPADRSQGRGNSGVYLPCGTEIQVLDSFGMPTYKGGGCGGLYRWQDPDAMETIDSLAGKEENAFTLASLPPQEWQVYDIEYRVRADADGQPAGFVTVTHNGIRIHDQVQLQSRPRKGGFHFQDHGNPVRYRNIWVLPVAATR